jgi:CubicO group peptidase (beta-lactamase class C family)
MTGSPAEFTRRGAIALGIGGVAAAFPASARGPRRRRDWSSLDALAVRFIAGGVTPGLQICVVEHGAPIHNRAFGAANLETGSPLTTVSAMRIGSLTKQFTAAAIMLLQEDGRLSVDDRLSRFVPEIEPGGQISLRQMLTHVSGLGISPAGSPIARRGTEIVELDADATVALIRSRNPVLRTPPGTRWEYNNLAYRLLGVVASRAAKMPYRELVASRLAQPAGLARTAVDDVAEIVPGRASGYEPGAAGQFRNAPLISLSWPGGAGAIRSTAEDLCKWHHALLHGRLLRPESLAAMLTPVRLNDGSLPVATPPGAADSQARTLRYGFGVRLEGDDGRIVTHTGAIEGFMSELTSYPEGISIAALTNSGRIEGKAGSPNEAALRAVMAEAARIARG